jgi:hypothetical protein
MYVNPIYQCSNPIWGFPLSHYFNCAFEDKSGLALYPEVALAQFSGQPSDFGSSVCMYVCTYVCM